MTGFSPCRPSNEKINQARRQFREFGTDPCVFVLHSCESIYRGLEFLKLILSERLGGEQIHGASFRIVHQSIQNRQVVAQRLAAGGGGDDDHVAPRRGMFERRPLMGVELAYATRDQRLPQRRCERIREIDELTRARRKLARRAGHGGPGQ